MADFKTHLTGSSVLGIGYGGVAFGLFGVPLPSCALAAGLCGVSGMLPDIDSGPGRPLREITTLMAAVVPTMLFRRLLDLGVSQAWIILIGAAIYAGIRFGVAAFLRRYTVHRGMFHSFPAAAIFAMLTFLLIYDDDTAVRWFVAGSVALGFLCHLCLDEIYSVQWDGRPRLKRSFGTALKFFAKGWWPNVSAYAKLAVLAFVVVKEPGLVEELHNGRMDAVVQDVAQGIRSSVPTSLALPSADRPAATQATESEQLAEPSSPQWPVSPFSAPVIEQGTPAQPSDPSPPLQPVQQPRQPDYAGTQEWPARQALGPADESLRR